MVITVDEIMELLGVSRATAYRIILELNQALRDKGYRTVHGKTSRQFFFENYYHFDSREVHNHVSLQR